MSIEHLLNELRPERFTYPEQIDFGQNIGVFCRLDEFPAARRFLVTRAPARINYLLTPDEDWARFYKAKKYISVGLRGVLGLHWLDLGSPLARQVQWVLFGRSDAGWQCLRLAREGIRRVWFSVPPEYGEHIRLRPEEFESQAPAYEKFLNRLADEESRLTLLSVIKQRLTGDVDYVHLANYPQYEHPIVGAEVGDYVIDVGAGKGEQTTTFADRVGPEGHVYAFEPDPDAYPVCAARCKTYPNVSVIQSALGDKNGVCKFVSKGGGLSHIVPDSPNNAMQISMTSIDSFVRDAKLPRVNMIKIDTEGSEMAVLSGAVETIRRFAPKLQVSVYHKPEDLLGLPSWILKQVPSYRLYLGHHGWQCETILYAKLGG